MPFLPKKKSTPQVDQLQFPSGNIGDMILLCISTDRGPVRFLFCLRVVGLKP